MSEKRFGCPCCGKQTLAEKGAYEICSVCGWEDDPVCYKNPDLAGANEMSLSAARDQFDRTGKRVR